MPNPGGRLRANESAATVVQLQPVARSSEPMGVSVLPSLNPLVNAALPILGLSVQIKNRATHDNVESLRDGVVAEVNAFERRITQLGLAPRTIRAARYALCATID